MVVSSRATPPPEIDASATSTRHSGQASPLFPRDVLQRRDIQHRLGEQFLELGVFILRRTKPFGLGHFLPAELRFPLVKGRRADPVAAAYFRLLLLQYPVNLLLAEPAALHPFDFLRVAPHSFLLTFQGCTSTSFTPIRQCEYSALSSYYSTKFFGSLRPHFENTVRQAFSELQSF